MHKLKYLDQIAEITQQGTPCPPLDAKPANTEGYRWVFDPVTVNCFAPQAVKNPPRLLNEPIAEKKCSCWALSMHGSLDQSISAFKALEASFKRAKKTLGDSIASGVIAPSDGICTPPDAHGHFDLHPFETANLMKTFAVVMPIP